MTLDEIVPTALLSVLLGAIIGVITNPVLIIILYNSCIILLTFLVADPILVSLTKLIGT